MGKRRVNFQRCWLPVSRIGLHRRGVERVNCGPKLLDLGEKGVYSSYTCRVPGGDYEGYVDAHVRRWRRYAGPVSSSGSTPTNGASPMIWSAVPPPMTLSRDSQASVRVLSPVDLNKQIGSDGATWLDRLADPRRDGRPCANRLRATSPRSHGPAPRAPYRTGRRHPQPGQPRLLLAQPSRHPAGARGSRRRIGYGFE